MFIEVLINLLEEAKSLLKRAGMTDLVKLVTSGMQLVNNNIDDLENEICVLFFNDQMKEVLSNDSNETDKNILIVLKVAYIFHRLSSFLEPTDLVLAIYDNLHFGDLFVDPTAQAERVFDSTNSQVIASDLKENYLSKANEDASDNLLKIIKRISEL